MTKPNSSKRNSSKNKLASSSKDSKTPTKRGRKAAPPIVRSTPPTIECSNIQPTPEEITSLDLPDHNYVTPNPPDLSISDSDDVHSEVPGFDDFTTKPPDILLRRSSRGANIGTTPPPRKRIKIVHPHKYDLSRLSKPQKQPDQQPDQSFQSPKSHPKEIENVSGVGVSPNTFSEK
ncbi:hypothetical protein EJD97_010057, partial [Solanum chilense]